MEVIKFRESDIDTVFRIQQAAYKPLFEKYHDVQTNPYMESKERVFEKYTSEGTQGYLFVKDGVPVGAVRVRIYPEDNTAKISALGVLPEYQGQKIAQNALRQIEELHRDADRWFLATILQEEGNCHLYEKLGYKRTGEPQVVNKLMTLVFYEKTVR